MATKKIQDLENIEEVLPDSIIPVGEATKTKSMLVSQFKNWLSSFFVSKTGDEIISGLKTFNNYFYVKNTNYAYNETPSSLDFRGFYVTDKNDIRMGACETMQVADGDNRIQINVFGKNGSWTTMPLGLGVTPSGETYTYAPASSRIDSIVTTRAISKGSDGYVKFGNGLIIQWGTINTPNKKTFSTPFTLTPRVVVARVNSSATNGTRTPVAHSVSTTGFTAYWYNSESVTYNWIAIGY